MKAVILEEFGGPEVMRCAEISEPEPGPGEVLIAVKAAGVNRADLVQRQGHYPPPPGASEILGLECAGLVAGLGSGLDDFRIGDPVMALLPGGGYAERVVADAGSVRPVPDGWSMEEAAAFPEVYATAWLNLGMLGGMGPGDRLLVHGGSGGVGTAAVQLAHAVGASIAVTAGSAERCRRCLDHGADAAFDYREDEWVDGVRQWTETRGPDIILDCIGASYVPKHQALLAPGGRWVVIGLMGGRRAEIDLAQLMMRRQTLIGSTLRSRGLSEKAQILEGLLEVAGPAIDSGAVRPVVDRVYDLERVDEAHRMLEAGEIFGKAVLRTA